MDGSELWMAVLVVVYVVVIAALVLYGEVSGLRSEIKYSNGDLRRDIEYRISDLHREVGAVKREVEYRANAHARDLERLLSDRRTSG